MATRSIAKALEPRLLWRAVTANHYVADIGDLRCAVAVIRRPTWKRTHPERPWRIEVFGSSLAGDWYEDLDYAKFTAERAARELVDSMLRDPLFSVTVEGRRWQ